MTAWSAGHRQHHVRQSVQATTASGVDNAKKPRLADTAERDYFTSERLITMQKQLEGTQKLLMSSDRVAYTMGNSCNYW